MRATRQQTHFGEDSAHTPPTTDSHGSFALAGFIGYYGLLGAAAVSALFLH